MYARRVRIYLRSWRVQLVCLPQTRPRSPHRRYSLRYRPPDPARPGRHPALYLRIQWANFTRKYRKPPLSYIQERMWPFMLTYAICELSLFFFLGRPNVLLSSVVIVSRILALFCNWLQAEITESVAFKDSHCVLLQFNGHIQIIWI